MIGTTQHLKKTDTKNTPCTAGNARHGVFFSEPVGDLSTHVPHAEKLRQALT